MKHLIIFGAGGALGRGVTESVKRDNYDRIWLVDRRPEKVADMENGVVIGSGDLTVEEEVKKVFGKIETSAEDELFLFTTVGGFAAGDSIEETEYALWKKMIDINLNTSFLIAKHFIPLVKKGKGGSICFTSAWSSFGVEKNKTPYNLSKNSLNYLAKSVSLEGKVFNLSANIIAPYIIDTPENREWMKDESLFTSPGEIGTLLDFIFTNYRYVNDSEFKLRGRHRIK